MSRQPGIAIHITSGEHEDWQMALRNLLNLAQDESISTPPELIQVVINGPAVRFLLSTAPEASKVHQMTEVGVEINVCTNSLDRFEYDPDDLVEGVSVVQSGVTRAVRLQQQGSTYLKLP